MRVLGIDPGLRAVGYGVIDHDGEMALAEAGLIRTEAKSGIGKRLNTIFEGVRDLIADTRPDVLVLEKLFAHYKHPATALLMGHARGAVCLAAERGGVEIHNIPSTRVKKAVISYGHASKQQIQSAVQGYLGLKNPPRPADVADALAIAIAYALTRGRSPWSRKEVASV